MRPWVLPVIGASGAVVTLGIIALARRTPLLKQLRVGGWSRSAPRSGRVLVLGDSIGAHGRFVQMLDQQLPSHSFDNEAVVGYSTGQMLTKADRLITPGTFSEVIVEGDLNDGDRSASWTMSNLRRIYQLARSAGARVIAVTSTPWKGYSRWTTAGQERQDEVRQWILNGADGLIDAAVDAYTPLEDASRPGYLLSSYAAADHLHLNNSGQERLARTILADAY